MDLETIFQGKMNEHKWRLLGDYLKGSKIQPGPGLIMESSPSNGISLSKVKERKKKNTQAPPFAVLSLAPVEGSDEFKATLQEGWVIDRITEVNEDAVEFHEVKIGASFMSVRPRPELTLEDGDFVSVYFSTNEDGHPTSVPVIQTDQTEQDSDHHQPASGAGSGASGYYYIKLFKFTIESGTPKITYYQQSDIEHSRLWTGRNVGGARYIHKEWSGPDDTYDFRTLKQNEPSGRTYGKVIVDEVGAEFADVNDAINFSAIAERLTSPQINVNDDGAGIVTIEGNGNDGSLTHTLCDETTNDVILTWKDGLITSSSDSFIAGCGEEFPSATGGEMLWFDSTAGTSGEWVVLENPGDPALGDDGIVGGDDIVYEHWELIHDGTSPIWIGVL